MLTNMDEQYLVDAVPVLENGRWVLEYTIKDSQGNPLGPKYHSYFVGDTPEACYVQAVRAHQLAGRAVARLRYKADILDKKLIALQNVDSVSKSGELNG